MRIQAQLIQLNNYPSWTGGAVLLQTMHYKESVLQKYDIMLYLFYLLTFWTGANVIVECIWSMHLITILS